jgi:hypothetical protein
MVVKKLILNTFSPLRLQYSGMLQKQVQIFWRNMRLSTSALETLQCMYETSRHRYLFLVVTFPSRILGFVVAFIMLQ